MDFTKTEFIKSAVGQKDFIRDGRPQVVFAGRSNVGKSSLINLLVRRKNFARVGSQPGKTSQINYFLIDKKIYLADLPGYGYAKVSKAERERWGRLMESYFTQRDLISLGVLIVDSRHKPTEDDIMMSKWFIDTGCPLIVAANKIDKVKKSQIEGNIQQIRTTLGLSEDSPVIICSAFSNIGRDALIAEIEKQL